MKRTKPCETPSVVLLFAAILGAAVFVGPTAHAKTKPGDGDTGVLLTTGDVTVGGPFAFRCTPVTSLRAGVGEIHFPTDRHDDYRFEYPNGDRLCLGKTFELQAEKLKGLEYRIDGLQSQIAGLYSGRIPQYESQQTTLRLWSEGEEYGWVELFYDEEKGLCAENSKGAKWTGVLRAPCALTDALVAQAAGDLRATAALEARITALEARDTTRERKELPPWLKGVVGIVLSLATLCFLFLFAAMALDSLPKAIESVYKVKQAWAAFRKGGFE